LEAVINSIPVFPYSIRCRNLVVESLSLMRTDVGDGIDLASADADR